MPPALFDLVFLDRVSCLCLSGLDGYLIYASHTVGTYNHPHLFIGQEGVSKTLPRLALNHNPPDLRIPSS
jgi:hypothetical protein